MTFEIFHSLANMNCPVQRVIEVSGTNEHVNDGEAWTGPGSLDS
jgi:hypothetical protein